MKSLLEFVGSGNILVAAHRGASGTMPENTLAAFNSAHDEGANMIETDLHISIDGHFVAYHDMDHFKNDNSYDSNMPDTLENLMKLDAGAWFDSKFVGLKIPMLQEIIAFAKKRIYLNLELKSENNRLGKKEMQSLMNIVYEQEFENSLMFSSFNGHYLKMAKDIEPRIPTAIINPPGQKNLPSKLVRGVEADAFICSVDELNPEIREDAKANDIFLAVYGVDDETNLKKTMNYGIKGIGTNFPGKIARLISDLY